MVVNLGKQAEQPLNRILVPIKDLSASAREQFELALRVLNTALETPAPGSPCCTSTIPVTAAVTGNGWRIN